MFPTKILLATDGSGEAAHAARMAATLAGQTGSELHAIYAEPLPDPYSLPEVSLYYPEMRHEMRGEMHEAADRKAREKLAAEVEKIGGMGGEVAGSHAVIGRPDAGIVRVAEEISAGLVVVGSRGLGPIRRAVMGSVSPSVARHAHGSVLVVRKGDENRVGPLVLAVDGSEGAKSAAGAAAEVSAATGSPVHLIHVMPTEAQLYGRHFYSSDVKESIAEEAKGAARGLLDGQARAVRSRGGEVAEKHLGTGRPDEEIVRLAEETGAGMVVVGSRGLGGVRRALTGSVSDSVMRHAHCSVLVVREDARDEIEGSGGNR